jgi:hypothetical protein
LTFDILFVLFVGMHSLQIIGTQRSGSNMLRLMLHQVQEIAAPHPPHILLSFFPLLAGYGDLENKGNFLRLADDICAFVQANPVSWEIDDVHGSMLVARCRQHTLIDLYTAIYEIYAERRHATIWCNKSMANLYFIPDIERMGLKPVYIHLVRDGRDVAVSFKNAIVGEKHIYHLARQWKQDQEMAEKLCREYAPDRYILIYYEDLIHDAEGTMRKLLGRLGLHYSEGVLDFYKTEEARHTAGAGKMWNNVVRPVMTQNSNKFLSHLSREDIAIFESIAGDTLAHFGYKPYIDSADYIPSFSPEQIDEFDKLNSKMKQEMTATLDPEGLRKRKDQGAIIQKIKAR